MEDGAASRRLLWDDCRNVRDLGGLPTADGGAVARGALVRADNLCRLTESGQAALIGHGVRTVIDVRFPTELALAPHPFGQPGAPVAYLNIPVSAGRDPADGGPTSADFAAARTRAELNRLEVDANPAGFARIAAAFARAPAGGVVVHCHAGKDRTGIAVALLLALVGVPDGAIAADYALSRASVEAAPPPGPPRPGAEPWWSRPEHFRDCEPEAMLATLAHLRRRHGGVEPYLRRGGATADDLAAARRRLLGPTGSEPP